MGVGEPLVQRRALGVQGEERPPVTRQRALCAPARAHAPPRLLGLDVEQHHDVLPQRPAHPLREHAAAAECEHLARLRARQQLADQLLLLGAKRALAAGARRRRRALCADGRADGRAFELLGQRMPEALFQQRIAVSRAHAQLVREPARDRRLTGTHEADQHERSARPAR